MTFPNLFLIPTVSEALYGERDGKSWWWGGIVTWSLSSSSSPSRWVFLDGFFFHFLFSEIFFPFFPDWMVLEITSRYFHSKISSICNIFFLSQFYSVGENILDRNLSFGTISNVIFFVWREMYWGKQGQMWNIWMFWSEFTEFRISNHSYLTMKEKWTPINFASNNI